MVIFQYNLYIFGINLWTVLYPKLCYNEPWYKEVEVYVLKYLLIKRAWSDCVNAQSPVWLRPLLPVYDIRVLFSCVTHRMSSGFRKPTYGDMCPMKTQISLHTYAVWSGSSLSIQNVPSDDFDRTCLKVSYLTLQLKRSCCFCDSTFICLITTLITVNVRNFRTLYSNILA